MSASGFRWRLRVYYDDTDAAGIVYYANYLKFMERARTEWLRSFGIDQSELADSNHVRFVVSRLGVHYREPARLDDQLDVTVDISRAGRAGFDLSQRVLRSDGVELAVADVRIACLHATRMKPCAIPSSLLSELRREN